LIAPQNASEGLKNVTSNYINSETGSIFDSDRSVSYFFFRISQDNFFSSKLSVNLYAIGAQLGARVVPWSDRIEGFVNAEDI
jgi:hypothetical protein